MARTDSWKPVSVLRSPREGPLFTQRSTERELYCNTVKLSTLSSAGQLTVSQLFENRKMWSPLPAGEQGWVWNGFTADSSSTSL